jgi:peptidoglycan-N-acetylglucosamine deacetylase
MVMTIELPAGTRMAVAMTVDFDAHSPWMGSMKMTTPSVLSRGEFGALVGVPRLLELFERLEIPTTWFTPAHDIQTFPAQVEAVIGGGHEIGAHGLYHENLLELDEEQEREFMARQLGHHEALTGRRPRGYRSPAWDFTPSTLQILEDFGFDWDSSLMGREFEPYHPREVTVSYESANTFGPETRILEFPVSWYLDDWPAVEYIPGVSPQLGFHGSMLRRWQDIFDYAYDRVPGALYTLTVHPQTIGRSHHIAGLERLLTNMRDRGDVWFAPMSAIYDAYTDD